MNRIFILLTACLLMISSTAFAQEVISLEKACELARQNSPQILAQKYATEAAEAQSWEAYLYWTPKLSFKSYFGPTPKTKEITASTDDVWDNVDDEWGFSTKNTLSFWIPLFTSTKVYHTNQLAKIGLKVEKLREENEIINVEYDVSRAYIGLQLANAAVDVVKEAESYVERIEKEYQNLLENESENVRDTDQYRIDIAKANLYRLRNDVEAKRDYAERALSVHTKLELPIVVEEMNFDNVKESLKSLDEITQLAHQYRTDLKLLDQADDAARLKARIEWLNWWPDLLLVGEARFNYSNAVPEYTIDNFYIGNPYNGHGFGMSLMLRWELDPVSQVFKVRQADAKAASTRAQHDLAIAGIDLEVAEQYQKTLNDLKNIDITYKSRRSAKRFLTQELMGYEAGVGNVNQIISALQTFIEQRSMYLYALHDYRVSLVKLQKTVGTPSTDMLIDTTAPADDEE